MSSKPTFSFLNEDPKFRSNREREDNKPSSGSVSSISQSGSRVMVGSRFFGTMPKDAILVVVGLAGLSLVVFALGLAAGYRLASYSATAARVYRLPNPPSGSDAAAAQIKSDRLAPTGYPSARPATTQLKTSRRANSSASLYTLNQNAEPGAKAPNTSASETPDLHHKLFNIQFKSTMDPDAAMQMTARLHQLGFPAFMVPNTPGDETWWRVQVGPYPSREAAIIAQHELHARYTGTDDDE